MTIQVIILLLMTTVGIFSSSEDTKQNAMLALLFNIAMELIK